MKELKSNKYMYCLYISRVLIIIYKTFIYLRIAFDYIIGIFMGKNYIIIYKKKIKLNEIKEYGGWLEAAKEIDLLQGYKTWSVNNDASYYNYIEINKRIEFLEDIKETDIDYFLNWLNTDFHRTSCGITNPPLFQYLTGTKQPIETYTKKIVSLLDNLPKNTYSKFTDQEKVWMLKQVMRSYGRTALIFNSSLLLGGTNLGVVKALNDANALPRVFFGSSSGSFIAALLCIRPSVQDVYNIDCINYSAFDQIDQEGSSDRKINRLLTEGSLLNVKIFQKFIHDNIGDLTFLEAFEKTGRILNIQCNKIVNGKIRYSTVLNYLTAPYVLIYSAVVTSCAFPYVIPFCPLLAKTIDGTIVEYEPSTQAFNCDYNTFHINHAVNRMRVLFNINCFILSDASILYSPLLRFQNKNRLFFNIFHFFTEEVWRLIAAISRIKCFKTRLTPYLQTIKDPIDANILINPLNKWKDINTFMLHNPDENLMKISITMGEIATWPKLVQIKTNVSIELALRRAYNQIRFRTLESTVCNTDDLIITED